MYFLCQGKGNETLSQGEAVGVPLSETQRRLADKIGSMTYTPGLKEGDFLLGGGEGEATEKETVEAAGHGEKRAIKQEAEEDRKWKKITRIREQVATVIKENDEVTRFTFPEANRKDASIIDGAQGFSYNSVENIYFKRVKNAPDSRNDVLYDDVAKMVCIPVFRTPDGTPSPQRPRGTPGTGLGGTGRGDIFGPDSKYEINGHDDVLTWTKFADSPSAPDRKMVR